MSVLSLKADIRQRWWHVRYVPQAEVIMYQPTGFTSATTNAQ